METPPEHSVLLGDDGEWVLSRRPGSAQRVSVLVLTPASRSVSSERLQREYEMRTSLRPEWAVRPQELAREVGKPTLVLEDPGGELLSAWSNQSRDVRSLVRIGAALANALAGAHMGGVVHQDVRPSNILVAPDGSVRLTGFGLAKRTDDAHPESQRVAHTAASFPYMAPEQTGRTNHAADARSDLYSLGITLYELLAGTWPFSAAVPMEWVHCHIARPPVPLREHAPGVPPMLAAIVMRLLAKAPEDRYQTAAGVEADLRRVLEQLEVGADVEFRLGENDTPDRLLLPERVYGRAQELDLLMRAFDRVVTEGTTGLLLVSGPSGIGKSAIVRELEAAIAASSHWFASGKYDQYNANVPYAPLAQAFSALVRRLLTLPHAELLTWRGSLDRMLGPNLRLMCDLVPEGSPHTSRGIRVSVGNFGVDGCV